MTLLDTTVLPFGLAWDSPGMQMASLDHAMWFHRPFRADDWLLYDQRAISTSSARGLAGGAIFTRDGRLVVSVVQEGLARVGDREARRAPIVRPCWSHCVLLAALAACSDDDPTPGRRSTSTAIADVDRRPATSEAPDETDEPSRRATEPTDSAPGRHRRPRRRRAGTTAAATSPPAAAAGRTPPCRSPRSPTSRRPSTWRGGPGDDGLYVVEQGGRIERLAADGATTDRARRHRPDRGRRRAGPARAGVRARRRPGLHQLHRPRWRHDDRRVPGRRRRHVPRRRQRPVAVRDRAAVPNHNGGDLDVRARRHALHRHGRRR